MICKCELPTRLEVGEIMKIPLLGGMHTQLTISRCKNCGGIDGFPPLSFHLAQIGGTPKAKKILELAEEWAWERKNDQKQV